MTENNKEKILEATLDLASEKGLGRVSISQIADKVGLKKSSIYSHYSSKDEIIEAMYDYYRNKTVQSRTPASADFGVLVEGKSLFEVLTMVTDSYFNIVEDPDMKRFYKVILSERAINPIAAEVMVAENQTMINATKLLFYALSAKGIANFENVDMAAFSFAMGVHSTLEYIQDARFSETDISPGIMEDYIREFCRSYGY